MAQAIVIPGADFSQLRSALPTKPVNSIPPILEGLRLYIPLKYNVTNGVITDPFGTSATDFTQVATKGKPTLGDSTFFGSKKALIYATSASPRIAIKNTIITTSKKWTVHLVYAIQGTLLNDNRAGFSFLSTNNQKAIRFQASSSVDSKSHLQTHSGAYTPLATNSLVAVKDTTLDFTPVIGQREIITIAHDATVNGGTFWVYRSGALINTVTEAGSYDLEGAFYLGSDIFSSSASSDFKGHIGTFMIYDTLQTIAEITPIYNYLLTAHS